MITIKQLICSKRMREEMKDIDFIKAFVDDCLENENLDYVELIDLIYSKIENEKEIKRIWKFIPVNEVKVFLYKCAEYLITGDVSVR